MVGLGKSGTQYKSGKKKLDTTNTYDILPEAGKSYNSEKYAKTNTSGRSSQPDILYGMINLITLEHLIDVIHLPISRPVRFTRLIILIREPERPSFPLSYSWW